MAEVALTPPSHAAAFKGTPGYKPAEPAAQVIETPASTEEPAPVVAAPAEDPVAPAEEQEMSDEDFAKLYEKKVGKKLKSIDDLKDAPKPKTAEEIALAAEKEKTEALEWGLGTEKIKRDFYEKSIADKAKDKRAIALQLFTEELKIEDPTMSADECEERFKDYYCEEEEVGSWKRNRALKAMEAAADNYLDQYKPVDTLVEDYRTYKTVAQTQKDYNKQLSTIGKEMPTKLTFEIPYTGLDGKLTTATYEVPVDEKIPAALIKQFSKPEMADYFGPNAKPEAITAELDYHLRARMQEQIIKTVVEKHAERVLEDTMVNLKNARNPLQPMGVPQQQSAPKELPSHAAAFKKK